MPAVLLDPSSSRRPRSVVRSTSRFASCLERLTAAGFRLVITAPAETAAYARGIRRFPDRQVDRGRHGRWDAAYRAFCGRDAEQHETASWRILAVDRDDQVIGAVTARFFCHDVDLGHLHVLSLLESTGPVLREHCEMAVGEVFAACARARRTPAEVSHWAVAPGWHAALVAVALGRAMGALAAAFDAPMVLLAADNRRDEGARLTRLGAASLGLTGRFSLPPFVHHASGAWIRLMLMDAATYQRLAGGDASTDLALLRDHAPLISAA